MAYFDIVSVPRVLSFRVNNAKRGSYKHIPFLHESLNSKNGFVFVFVFVCGSPSGILRIALNRLNRQLKLVLLLEKSAFRAPNEANRFDIVLLTARLVLQVRNICVCVPHRSGCRVGGTEHIKTDVWHSWRSRVLRRNSRPNHSSSHQPRPP